MALMDSSSQDIFYRATASKYSWSPVPGTVLVSAHPKDQAVALGALGRFQTAHIVHITDGAPRNEQDSRKHGFAPQKRREAIYVLWREEKTRKEALSAGFATQRQTLSYLTLECERFGVAPECNFKRPPHPTLSFATLMRGRRTSQDFCQLTQQAEAALKEEMTAACP